jgi:hypothetical protein
MSKNGNGHNGIGKPTGRPSALTPENAAIILEHVRRGNYREVAAQAVGIAPLTFRRWIDQGEIDIEAGDVTTCHAIFCTAVKSAEAQAEINMLAEVTGRRSDWQRFAWILERKAYKRWGKRQQIEMTGANGGAIEISGIRDRLMAELAGGVAPE